MKNWKFKSILCIVMSLMMLFSTSRAYASTESKEKPTFEFDYDSVDIDDEGEELTRATVTMSLNTKYSGTLTAGSVDTYYFTPSTSGDWLYVVETFGSTDTYGTLTGAKPTGTCPSGSYTNDDSGGGSNFAIGFVQTNGKQVTIKVRHYNSASGTGSYQIQVRRQRASLYGFNYGSGNINTTTDVSNAMVYTSAMKYNSTGFLSASSSHILVTDTTGLTRLNSEIVFFAGHGSAGFVVFRDSSNSNFLDTAFTSMKNTKVAVWAACQTATDPDGTGPRRSIAQKSIDMGARSAIGWTTNVDDTACRKWAKQFFLELNQTMTVTGAAASAGSIFLWPWEGSYAGWQVLGTGNTTINYEAVNHKSSTTPASISQAEFDAFIKNFEYAKYELKGLGTRYYKTINGLLTNEYYDVWDDGETIIKSQNAISQNDISQAKQLQFINSTFKAEKSVVTDGISFDKLINSEDYTVYMKIKGQMIPIKIVYADYESQSGIAYQKVTCINLLDNSFIDYKDICTDE